MNSRILLTVSSRNASLGGRRAGTSANRVVWMFVGTAEAWTRNANRNVAAAAAAAVRRKQRRRCLMTATAGFGFHHGYQQRSRRVIHHQPLAIATAVRGDGSGRRSGRTAPFSHPRVRGLSATADSSGGGGSTTTTGDGDGRSSSDGDGRSSSDDDRNSNNNRAAAAGRRRHRKKNNKNKNRNNNKKKWTVADTVNDGNARKLAAAFDEIAKREGFDGSVSYYADDATFEDDFDDEDYDAFFNDNDDDEADAEAAIEEDDVVPDDDVDDDDDDDVDDSDDDDMDARIAAARRGDDFFIGGDDNDDNDVAAVSASMKDDDENLGDTKDDDSNNDAVADQHQTLLLQNLGYRTEANFFGNDEVPPREGDDETDERSIASLVTSAAACPACGADFQCQSEHRPGYLPVDKYEAQMELARTERQQRRQQEWSVDDEIEWLLRTSSPSSGKDGGNSDDSGDKNDDASLDGEAASVLDDDADEDDDDTALTKQKKKTVICQRCHRLQNFGAVDAALRPGWTAEPALQQVQFRQLLRPIAAKPAVIIAVVDVFDFAGSVLPELNNIIVGNDHDNNDRKQHKHAVILAANKADLLPQQAGPARVERWVRQELEYMGVSDALLQRVSGVGGGAVRLISCKTGRGVADMLNHARKLASKMIDCQGIYLVGAANAGKSTLLNYILDRYGKRNASSGRNKNNDSKKKNNRNKGSSSNNEARRKYRPGNANARKGAITVSPLPGTTLRFIRVDLGGDGDDGNGVPLYDTPGLLVPGTITQLLTAEELKMVVPKKQVEPITFRVTAGKCVLVGGGLAKIELLPGCKPFLFTFFVSNDVKLHPTTAAAGSEDFVTKHVGTLLTPPLLPSKSTSSTSSSTSSLSDSDDNDENDNNDDNDDNPAGRDRLERMKAFRDIHEVQIEGDGWKKAAADVCLTGLGWVAVTGAGTASVRVTVPAGVAVSVRPPLMPYDVWDVTAKHTGGRAVRKSGRTVSGKRRKGVGRR